MFVSRKRYVALVSAVRAMQRRLERLEKGQGTRRTVSQLTLENDGEKYTAAELIDEWLNGKESNGEG